MTAAEKAKQDELKRQALEATRAYDLAVLQLKGEIEVAKLFAQSEKRTTQQEFATSKAVATQIAKVAPEAVGAAPPEPISTTLTAALPLVGLAAAAVVLLLLLRRKG